MIPLPNTAAKFVDNLGKIVSPFIQYLQQFTQAPPNFLALTVGASPYEYEAKEPGFIYIINGTISSIILSRGLINLTATGIRFIPVAIKDRVTITYTVLPTAYFIPNYGQNTFNM